MITLGRPAVNRTSMLRLSVGQETRERLAAYAAERHSSMSQVVIDWIWSVKLKSENDATGTDTKGD